MPPAVGLLVAYLLGSIPTAYLAGRWSRGIDLRQHGSGNLGATNVYRVLGAKVAALVLAVDVAKGALPVWLLPALLKPPHAELWALAYGVAAIIGHVRPVFLLWKGGGKGVATASGVFLALAPLAILVAAIVWVVAVVATGYGSVGSLAGAVALPIALGLTRGVHSSAFIASLFVVAFVFWTHRANIGRLRRGEEPRFGRKRGERR